MRPARVLIAILGLDQHETGALAVSSMLRDAGMEVVYIGRFATPATIARVAFDEAIDVVGVSAHSWEYLHFVDDLVRALGDIPLVVGGSVITPSDGRSLVGRGVAAVFGPSSSTEAIVTAIDALAARGRQAEAV